MENNFKIFFFVLMLIIKSVLLNQTTHSELENHTEFLIESTNAGIAGPGSSTNAGPSSSGPSSSTNAGPSSSTNAGPSSSTNAGPSSSTNAGPKQQFAVTNTTSEKKVGERCFDWFNWNYPAPAPLPPVILVPSPNPVNIIQLYNLTVVGK